MILDRLSSYLQNQPFKTSAPDKSEAISTSVLGNKPEDEQIPEELHLSNRAAYLEYLSQEFDVTAMTSSEMNDLQSKLSDYGFIASNDLNGMRSLSLAKQLTEPQDTINAVDMLDNFRNKFDELQIPYSMRQQIEKVNIVIQNMASARTFPERQSVNA